MTRQESFADGWRFCWGLIRRLFSPEFSKWAFVGFLAAMTVFELLSYALERMIAEVALWAL